MDEHDTTPAKSDTRLTPGLVSSVAWTLQLVILVVAGMRDPCAGSYAAQPLLAGLLVVALVVQLIAVGAAIARLGIGVANAGRSLAWAVVSTLCALPAARLMLLAIYGFCLDFSGSSWG